jgi:ABC-type lipoprotein export system ATPase subunit
MCRERKITIMMVTHNRELARLADRIVEMKAGELRAG